MALTIFGWAVASLAGSQLNDFASPAGYLTAALSSLLQNTPPDSSFVASPFLPQFLSSNSTGIPWGNRTVKNSDPSSNGSIPNTGVTRTYNFTVSRGIIAADGFNKSAILVNGQYPGPLLEGNWGDYIEVTVHNQIVDPAEGTTIHLHGITENGTPWFDGTPGVSQCPIAPGSAYTYKARADFYGTSWYHSHYSAQYTAGLYGPLVVHGPSSADYDIDVGPVVIHDYYRTDYHRILENAVGSNPLTALLNPSDSTFIHGGSNYVCFIGEKCESNPGLSGFTFTPGKRHRLRIINPSTLTSPMVFSIDNHTMTIIANDFTPVNPYVTDVISLASGQRTDVIVEATGALSQSYWMRARQPDLCSFTLQPFGLAAIYYADTTVNVSTPIPTTVPPPAFNAPRLETCANDPLNTTTPSYPIPAATKPDTILTITSNVGLNATDSTIYTMNGQAYRADYNQPLLALAATGNAISSILSPARNAYDLGANATVWLVFNNNMSFAHPMHLHGQQFQILAEGQGTWDGTSITNPQNPQRRDTQIVQANGYAVFQLSALNAGVWPFHCHIAWHLSQGMNVNLIMQADKLRRQGQQVQDIMRQSCDAWQRWTDQNVVDGIDSGI